MTVARPGRPLTQLDVARQHVEQALGPTIAKRLDTFKDGTFYVTAGDWARLFSWLVDFVVYLLCATVGVVVVAVAMPDAANSVLGLTVLGLLVGVPILYGAFFGNGRVLGGVLTGTRLVRLKDGGRIGAGACWAMLVRTILFPALLAAMTVGGTSLSGDLTRISIDDDATRRLHAAGFLRLNESGSAR